MANPDHTPRRTFRLDDEIMADLTRIETHYRVNQTTALKIAVREVASRLPQIAPQTPLVTPAPKKMRKSRKTA